MRLRMRRGGRPEHRLLTSALFDEEWYSRQAGAAMPRETAVEHYLSEGAARGLQPHPLVDPLSMKAQWTPERLALLGEEDPLTFYLRRGLWGTRPHPLFDVDAYLERTPEAREHPDGPVGHYVTTGAAAGLPANDWLDGDLGAWLQQQYDVAVARRARAPRLWRGEPSASTQPKAPTPAPPLAMPPVSVVLDSGWDELVLEGTVADLPAGVELILLDRGGLDPATLPSDVMRIPAADPGAALGQALRRATRDYVAFAQAGDYWESGRLERLLGAGAEVVADELSGGPGDVVRYAIDVPPNGPHRVQVDASRLLVRRDLLPQIDETLNGAWLTDLVLQLPEITHVPVVGVHRTVVPENPDPPLVDHERIAGWADAARNHRLVDWAALAERRQDPDTVSVIIPTFDDVVLTQACVESLVAAGDPQPEIIVWDNGSRPEIAAALESLPLRFPRLTLRRSEENLGFALGNNLALPDATGATVVFLNNDTTVPEGWLRPLREALAEEDVLGVQPLLVYPSGSIQSAGVAFAPRSVPHPLLQGFPVEDASRVSGLKALTGAALALRWDDVVAMRGFDPVFTNGMEDVDLCLRLGATRAGSFALATEKPVVHHESRTPGRYARFLTNRALYLDRWPDVPADDAEQWASAGLDVVGHEVRHQPKDRRLGVREPIVVRRRTTRRWAIKNPAPAGPRGDTWGDTHFADALARALRELGQEVVIDRRQEFERATGRHDDVVLVLRGLFPYRPAPGQVTLAWVISHPELLTRAEAESYTKVFAAGAQWARRRSKDWGIGIEPLLQATDPARFRPGVDGPPSDYLFVGGAGLNGARTRPVVEDALAGGLPLTVYGEGWSGLAAWAGESLPNDQVPGAYGNARFVLNDHWADMRAEGFLSNRLFDAVAAGARVITDEIEGLEIFGDSVRTYRTGADLAALTERDFGDAEARRRNAERIREQHSFAARAAALVRAAEELGA